MPGPKGPLAVQDNMNMDYKQKSIEQINYLLFLKVVREIKNFPITQRACLGYTTNDIILFGQERPNRVSVVSVRNHSGMYSMLITDPYGSFLFNGGFSMRGLTCHQAAEGLEAAFNLVKNLITTT